MMIVLDEPKWKVLAEPTNPKVNGRSAQGFDEVSDASNGHSANAAVGDGV